MDVACSHNQRNGEEIDQGGSVCVCVLETEREKKSKREREVLVSHAPWMCVLNCVTKTDVETIRAWL